MNKTIAVLCCAYAAASLQTAAAEQARQQPTDPAATVPPVQYASAFAGYRPLGNDNSTSWREVNDEVARAGGHAGIQRNPARGTAPAAGHAGHAPGAPK